jgi:hypothetical protein
MYSARKVQILFAGALVFLFGMNGFSVGTVAWAEPAVEDTQQSTGQEQATQEQDADQSGAAATVQRSSEEASNETAEQPAAPQASTASTSAGQPVSLLSIAGNMLFILFAIIAAGSLLMCGPALLCAIVYHVGNVFRGGQRPTVG